MCNNVKREVAMGFILTKIYDETGKHTPAHQLVQSPPSPCRLQIYCYSHAQNVDGMKTQGNPYGLHYDGDHDNVLFTKWASEDTH